MAALIGYAVSVALFIVPLLHFLAIPAAPAIGSVIASNMLPDPRHARLRLAAVLTVLWELPVAAFGIMKLAGVGFMAAWSGAVIVGIGVGVAVWAFSLAIVGSLVAGRVLRYARARQRGRAGGDRSESEDARSRGAGADDPERTEPG